MLLDVHNLYCQLHNFDLDVHDVLSYYPTHRVKQIHVSGGSWSYPVSDPYHRSFRRDTHDNDIPSEVFALLPIVLEKCVNTEVIIFERQAHTINTKDQKHNFYEDYKKLKDIVILHYSNTLVHKEIQVPLVKHWIKSCAYSGLDECVIVDEKEVICDDALSKLQTELLILLRDYSDPNLIKEQMLKDTNNFGTFSSWIVALEPRCIEICAELVKKWGKWKS
eukprot:TRINITY_DN10564_c0_g2_i1.p1 TRINITY_DN10564_c0_g2~~TRINITY_DN10564_c0_g2_i1.p1  ORF type:complete len:221 (+),score=20.14 TRINITY_DN10564_c0_g2_i1:65-727(+)